MKLDASVRRSFSRRSFFKGLGYGALVAGPLWRVHYAQAAGQPKVILFYIGGGLKDGHFRQPLANGASLATSTLTGGLDALETPELKSIKSYFTVVEGVYHKWAPSGIDTHQQSAAMSLRASGGGGTSLDRVLAEHLGGATFPSVRLKVVRGKYDHGLPSTGGNASLSKSFLSPASAYDGMFKGIAPSSVPAPAGAAPPPPDASDVRFRRDVLGRQASECRLVVAETERQLGRERALKVMNHCDALAQMAAQIDAISKGEPAGAGQSPGGLIKCPPEQVDNAGFGSGENLLVDNLPKAMDSFNLLAVNAVACNRTRVVLYEMWTDQPGQFCTWMSGVAKIEKMEVHDQIFHSVDTRKGFTSEEVRAGQLHYTRWFVTRFGRMVKLAQDIGILDDTVLVWVTNEPNGGHGFSASTPCFYAGKGGGRFVAGKYLKAGSVSINDVYASLLRGCGASVQKFGDDRSGRSSYGIDSLMLTS